MTVTTWIMSIVGVAVLGVLVETLLPEGNIQRHIRSIFAVIVLFVIISPLPDLINSNKSLELPANTEEIVLDEGYLTAFYKARVTLYEKSLISELASNGWNGVGVTIYVDSYTESMKITGIVLDLKKLVIDENLAHILSYDEAVELIATKLNVNKGLITRI